MTRDSDSTTRRLSRRGFIKGIVAAATAGGVAAGIPTLLRDPRRARAGGDPDRKPTFLVVFATPGGASIIDAMLAIRHSESANFERLNCFPDEEVISVPDSPFRAVDLQRDSIGPIPFPLVTKQSEFVARHKRDMMVVTATTTSLTHSIAQKRSLTGNNAWNGRTLQEAVAIEYGADYPIANTNMGYDGYIESGDDPTVPAWARNEPISQATLWPLGLHSSRGLKDLPDPELIDLARSLRNGKLDPESTFYRTFELSERLQRWRSQRGASQRRIEANDLVSKLNAIPDSPDFPLAEFGFAASPDAARMQQIFPDLLADPLEAQAALAFLLLKYRVSVTVTISPTFASVILPGRQLRTTPLAFDYSHTAHRAAQAAMWKRTMGMADRLIDLLKSEEFEQGQSLWDRTVLYFATDFGRQKQRINAADSFSTSHDVNNGFLVMSPLVNGNRVLGGVDPNTGLTYGFDLKTGQPDVHRTTQEAEVYAGLLQVLGVSTTGSGLPDVPAMRRG
ncbi:MAG: hypothetical protein MJE77_36280 [Proteobacteria bacterium]|nr:hypothetical protein [Pseudomonadota bacterium]